ncbi:MAG: N-acetylglutaminylglutamine synthetase [Acidimicrobiales bacterium]|nr:N-acetylglutaminylglutamine synthetase [Acidimicrobiales bacterium]
MSSPGAAPRRPSAPARGWDRPDAISSTSWKRAPEHLTADMHDEVVLEAGWGRLVFGQTFADHERLRDVLRKETTGRRDICLYLHDPHVLVATFPQEFFIDPSYTYRIWTHDYRPQSDFPNGVSIHQLRSREEAVAMNRVYVRCGMVPADVDVLWDNQRTTRHVTYLVAIDEDTGDVIGTVTGVDHARLFADPDNGCSLWCLAVDPASNRPGVGERLVRTLLERFKSRGRAYLDLSVMHDNAPAIALYEKLGFSRVPVMGVKRKNAINERLFAQSPADDLEHLNPYARIVADEALRRGIRVKVLDADGGYMRLEHGGRSIVTRESLSELTTAVAMSRCDDKRVTRRVVSEAGVTVPVGRSATFDRADHEFLDDVESVVVKPARGEQGQGITVGVTGHQELDDALDRAGGPGSNVLIEERSPGEDLRILVVNGAAVAAAVRRPATVVGNGIHTIRELIDRQSRRRAAATGGESTIPMDDVTVSTVAEGGWEMDEVLPEGHELQVRKTANLHTGGTIHDVTDVLHPELAKAALRAADAIAIPVTGIDLLVPRVDGPDYVFIEANERPGLANHEPRTPASDFIDYLFPGTRPTPWAWQPEAPDADQHRLD